MLCMCVCACMSVCVCMPWRFYKVLLYLWLNPKTYLYVCFLFFVLFFSKYRLYLCKQNYCVCICVGWCVRDFVRIYYLCWGGITVLVCSCGQELLLYSQSNQPAVLCANKQGTAINTDIKHVPLWRVCVFKSVCKRKEERERKTRKSVALRCSLKQNITAKLTMCHSWG